jgi:hypothetical protein
MVIVMAGAIGDALDPERAVERRACTPPRCSHFNSKRAFGLAPQATA